MCRYLTLLRFTDQGIRDVKDSQHRAAKFRNAVTAAGGGVLGQYWALGEVDGAVLFEAPDELTAARLLLDLGRDGFVRTSTIRMFEAAEFERAVTKR